MNEEEKVMEIENTVFFKVVVIAMIALLAAAVIVGIVACVQAHEVIELFRHSMYHRYGCCMGQ